MYRRFDMQKRDTKDASGKWQRVRKTGVGHVLTETDGTWEIAVTQRRVGTTIRREVFSVSIRAESPHHDEFLSGFTSKELALESAKQRIAMLDAVQRLRQQRQPG